jgi:hypothetical protein
LANNTPFSIQKSLIALPNNNHIKSINKLPISISCKELKLEIGLLIKNNSNLSIVNKEDNSKMIKLMESIKVPILSIWKIVRKCFMLA